MAKARKVKSDRLSKIFERINTPEFKLQQIQRHQDYLDKVTMDYQLGNYVGEYIVDHYLPTLSTDMLTTKNVIKVSEEDKIENDRLHDEWSKTIDYTSRENKSDKEKWELYRQHNKMLEKKYLPDPLVCHLCLLKFNDELEFKKGLYHTLWNCDRCAYDIEPKNVKIEYEMEIGFTVITFRYDVNNDVEIEDNKNLDNWGI
jgi:hypothetical protein